MPSSKDHLLKPYARSLRRPSLHIMTKVSTPTAPILSPLCPPHPCQQFALIPSFAYTQTQRFQWHNFPSKDHLLKPYARSLLRPSLDIITRISTPTAPILTPLYPPHLCQHLALIPSFAYAQTQRFQWHNLRPKTIFSNLPHVAYEDSLWT